MPMLHSMAHDMCCAANNVAQSALINQCARLLMRAAEKRIRRGPNPQPVFSRKRRKLFALLQTQNQGLFRIGMFARLKNCLRGCKMRCRYGQIDNNINIIRAK